MKINYLAYLDPYRYAGGGEQIMKKVLEAAKTRGHDVRISSKDGVDQHPRPDIWYLCDVYNCPTQDNRSLYPLIDSIVNGNDPYCHHDNAYVDLCWHGAIPCNGQGADGSSCHVRGGPCSIDHRRPLYGNARLCSFLSPLHRDVHLGALGPRALAVDRTIMIPPTLYPDMFRNLGLERPIKYLSYGGHGEAKGYHNIRQHFPKGSVVCVGGWSRELLQPDEGHWIGQVSHDLMPYLLNRTENLVHLPRWPEPFGLIIAEAALCGCNLIVNENVGALSWRLDLKDPATYADSPVKYWQELEEKI